METVDSTTLRRINTSAALRALHDSGPMTLAQLKTASGLSRRTLDLIVAPLIEQGWALDAPPAEDASRAAGRPARTFAFNRTAAYVIAIQLDFDFINVLISDLTGGAVAEAQIRTLPDPVELSRDARLEKVYECTRDALQAAQVAVQSIVAVTLSTPGIVRDNGMVDLPLSSMQGWSGFSLSQELERFFPCSVVVENDTKLAAIGERWAGGVESDNLIWVRADGPRNGVGVVINGELYRGKDGTAGEIVWAENLRLNVVSSHLMAGLVDPSHELYPQAILTANAARSGDLPSLEIVRDLAEALAPALRTLAWILGPDEIVVGGSLGDIADILIPPLRDALGSGARPVEAKVVGSSFGSRASLLGALKRSLDKVDELLFAGNEVPPPPGREV